MGTIKKVITGFTLKKNFEEIKNESEEQTSESFNDDKSCSATQTGDFKYPYTLTIEVSDNEELKGEPV